MENPATWGPAEKVVHKVLREARNVLPEFRDGRRVHPANLRFGLSLERQITDALREAGLLSEDTEAISHTEDHEEKEEDNG